jgi:hypothetical protein
MDSAKGTLTTKNELRRQLAFGGMHQILTTPIFLEKIEQVVRLKLNQKNVICYNEKIENVVELFLRRTNFFRLNLR